MQQDPGAYLTAGVVRGMTPFNPVSVDIWYEQDLDYMVYVFYVRARVLPDYVFKRKVDDSEFLTAYNPIHVFEMLGAEVSEYFRNIYVQPESNIILGET